MDWQDTGIVLSVRRHGESAAVVSLMTRAHGRHGGLVRGAKSPGNRGMLQPGNLVQAAWRARLADHLGTYTLEPLAMRAAPLLDDPGRLAALASACALVDTVLPERQAAEDVFDLLADLTAGLAGEGWAGLYARWEFAMLSALGYGLDLSHCAATGVTDDLVYVSPKSGRAVSASAGAPYRERLLPLPAFLKSSEAAPELAAVADALRLTGYFLARHGLEGEGRTGPARLPDARERLIGYLLRASA